jgi:hypothetical protein
MTSEVRVKAYPRKDRGGWIVYMPKSLVEDSGFPLDSGKKIVSKIDGNKIILKNC